MRHSYLQPLLQPFYEYLLRSDLTLSPAIREITYKIAFVFQMLSALCGTFSSLVPGLVLEPPTCLRVETFPPSLRAPLSFRRPPSPS